VDRVVDLTPEEGTMIQDTQRATRSLAQSRLSVGVLALRTGLHPDLIRRLVGLRLVEAYEDASGELTFSASAPERIARIQRLRTGLAISYKAVGLVLDLLELLELQDCTETLASALRASQERRNIGGASPRTRTG
jgi:hypothetical protein